MKAERRFSLVELLVVVAVISMLMSLLLPALGKAKAQARSLGCKNNLKSLGTANVMYADDWGGHVIRCASNVLSWEGCLAPYLGVEVAAALGNACPPFICPESHLKVGWNKGCAVLGGGWVELSCRLDEVKYPSAKFLFIDASHRVIAGGGFFFPDTVVNGRVRLAHPGRTANIYFFDGHVGNYGAPPIPPLYNATEESKWIPYNTDPPNI